MKFSDCIIELTEMWLLWMKNWNIVNNKTLSIKERKDAAMECEKLIDKEYIIVDKIDSFFKK